MMMRRCCLLPLRQQQVVCRELSGGWKLSTALVHGDKSLSHLSDVAAPIGVSTTFERADDDSADFVYSRSSAPTRSRCEALLGALEGPGVSALLFSSGLSAVHAAFSGLLGTEKVKRVLISGGYHGTHEALRALQRTGSPLKVEALDSVLEDGDVLWLETPKNPTAELADVEKYVCRARKKQNCNVIVDATLGPPPLQYPLHLGARMAVHSATKYFAGHSDCLAGVVFLKTDDTHLLEELRRTREAIGTVPGSLETWLLLRSLRTLDLRIKRQTKTASDLADFLRTQDHMVKEVHHFANSPLAKTQMPLGVGATFAIDMKTEAQARALPKTLTLFKDATSLGGIESLAEWRRKYDNNISPTLVRLSVGLEHLDDLIQDFNQAFDKINNQKT